MEYREVYEKWCENTYFDEDFRNELKNLTDEEEIKDRFYKDLEFGTGGLRGVIGAGTNRINVYTVRKATQGLANYIISKNLQSKGVAIAYDSRRMSPEFARETALCLCANGIKAYIFDSLRPTPELSFALRELKCIAGVVITASHNPPEYNGYKVYWEDGAQITSPLDKEIITEVNKVTDYNNVKTMALEAAVKEGLYNVIGKDIDDRYMQELKKSVINPELVKEMGKSLKIVYTPIHGTGNIPARRILSEIGFENVYVVKEQELPDENFSTVSYPNPEDPKVFELALKLAGEVDADIIMATDPDADRLGVYAKDSKTGEYMAFTGNMSGMLICEYILSQKKSNNTLPDNGAIVTTIVSTNMAREAAKEYGVEYIETLTGFKYIGEQIKLFEQNNSFEYLFGFEESYGCLVGTHARDKDAIAAVMSLCEAAAYYKKLGKTIWDGMVEIFEKYGYYKEALQTKTLKGIEGADRIKEIIKSFRDSTPGKIGGKTVLKFRDYEEGTIKDLVNGGIEPTKLPKSNVLYFELEGDAWCCVRPSGTEPKIKFYMGAKADSFKAAENEIKSLSDAMLALAD